MGFDWFENWCEVLILLYVIEDMVYFLDGISKWVDVIILCMGYKYYFLFLFDDLWLKMKNWLVVVDLYCGVVYVYNFKLLYFGMQDQWFIFNMFDVQVWYVCDIIMDCIVIFVDK